MVIESFDWKRTINDAIKLTGTDWFLFSTKLIDVVAPPRCMGCCWEGTWLCRSCRERVLTVPKICVGCKKESPQGRTCPRCRKKIQLTGVVSVGLYENVTLRRGIHWLKFKGIKDVADTLASLLVINLSTIAPLPELQRSAALVPVPLHKRRWRQRGFNQSMELCKAINKYTSLPILDCVVRTKSTWTQAQLPANLREENVANAFTVKEASRISVDKLIIVDDVTTSGATLSAVARPLWQQGVKEVWGLTVARS